MNKRGFKIQSLTAVLVVDVQRDFTIGKFKKGALAVPGANENYVKLVSSKTNDLKREGYAVYASMDWHPAGHISFYESCGSWPRHCVQRTKGAELLLDTALFSAVFKKGVAIKTDSYSAFFSGGMDETGLRSYLKNDGVQNLIIYGVATDYCVKSTALDALNFGFATIVLKDFCRSVSPDPFPVLKSMVERGVIVV
jgi:nicotinamidase/pyrazinamidase